MPEVDAGALAGHSFMDYALRFAFGAAISLVAGLIGLKLGPAAGGVFLGFPAILPASLTLIQRKEGREQAAIDSLGAVLGALAMIAFAALVAGFVMSWGPVLTLAAGLAAWLLSALALYALVRAGLGRRGPSPGPS